MRRSHSFQTPPRLGVPRSVRPLSPANATYKDVHGGELRLRHVTVSTALAPTSSRSDPAINLTDPVDSPTTSTLPVSSPLPITPHSLTKSRNHRMRETMRRAAAASAGPSGGGLRGSTGRMFGRRFLFADVDVDADAEQFDARLHNIEACVAGAGFVRNSSSGQWKREAWAGDTGDYLAGASARPSTASRAKSPGATGTRRSQRPSSAPAHGKKARSTAPPVSPSSPKCKSALVSPVDRVVAKLDAARRLVANGKPLPGSPTRRSRRVRNESSLSAMSDIVLRNVLRTPLMSPGAQSERRHRLAKQREERIASAKSRHQQRLEADIERAKYHAPEARHQRLQEAALLLLRQKMWITVITQVRGTITTVADMMQRKAARVQAVREDKARKLIQFVCYRHMDRKRRSRIRSFVLSRVLVRRHVRRMKAAACLLSWLRNIRSVSRLNRVLRKLGNMVARAQRSWRNLRERIAAQQELAWRQWLQADELRLWHGAAVFRAIELGEERPPALGFVLKPSMKKELQQYLPRVMRIPSDFAREFLADDLRRRRVAYYQRCKEWRAHMTKEVLPHIRLLKRGAEIAARIMHKGSADTFVFDPETLARLDIRFPPKPRPNVMLSPEAMWALLRKAVDVLERRQYAWGMERVLNPK